MPSRSRPARPRRRELGDLSRLFAVDDPSFALGCAASAPPRAAFAGAGAAN
jgi:hypothetical protein